MPYIHINFLEANCDYVRLLNSDNRELPAYGEERYTGRGSDRKWAGVDTLPAVVIPGDCFEVHFHSDSSNTDHGFRLLAYGVVEEPTAEDRAQFAALRRKVLSYWILFSPEECYAMKHAGDAAGFWCCCGH
jgi:hypothetical protein